MGASPVRRKQLNALAQPEFPWAVTAGGIAGTTCYCSYRPIAASVSGTAPARYALALWPYQRVERNENILEHSMRRCPDDFAATAASADPWKDESGKGQWQGSYGSQGEGYAPRRDRQGHQIPPGHASSRRVPSLASRRPCGPPAAALQMLNTSSGACGPITGSERSKYPRARHCAQPR